MSKNAFTPDSRFGGREWVGRVGEETACGTVWPRNVTIARDGARFRCAVVCRGIARIMSPRLALQEARRWAADAVTAAAAASEMGEE